MPTLSRQGVWMTLFHPLPPNRLDRHQNAWPPRYSESVIHLVHQRHVGPVSVSCWHSPAHAVKDPCVAMRLVFVLVVVVLVVVVK